MITNASFTRQHKRRQRGVALFVVIVFVLLSMLLALWASRAAWFNELVVGNDADYQRAFEAAQAMLGDAELDIQLGNSDLPGITCGGSVCRRNTDYKFPLKSEPATLDELLVKLSHEVSSNGCREGLCAKLPDPQSIWSDKTALDNMKSVAARYGDYTAAALGNNDNPINPILSARNLNPDEMGAWYWIEVLPYHPLLGAECTPNPEVLYRITALAQGFKSNTRVMLTEVFCVQPTTPI